MIPSILTFPGGLRMRLTAVITVLVGGVAIGGAWIFTRVAEQELTAQFERTMGSLASNLARNAAHGVFIESGEVLSELADHLMDEPDVVAVEIVNARGERVLLEPDGGVDESEIGGVVKAAVRYDLAAEREVDDEFAPFVMTRSTNAEPTVIGEVRVTYTSARLESEMRQVRSRVWLAAAMVAIAGVFLGGWLADRTVKPLHALSRATSAVAAGDLEARVEEKGDDEIANLARSFNRMTEALKGSRQKLGETYEELGRKERLATMGQFTAVIAHELKNPLGVILSSAQVITNPKRTPEMKEKAAQFIVEEVRRLNADLTGFLNFARPKAPDLKPVDLADVARRAVAAWRGTPGSFAAPGERTPTGEPNTPSEGGISAHVHADPDRPLALADADQIHHLLVNLLLNAAQAIAGGPDAPTVGLPQKIGRIDIRIGARGERVALVVEDDGPGMPADVKERVFEPFFTTKKRGSGLGLAVVNQVARSHGGSVELWSEPGKGTRFTILLPTAAHVRKEIA